MDDIYINKNQYIICDCGLLRKVKSIEKHKNTKIHKYLVERNYSCGSTKNNNSKKFNYYIDSHNIDD
jgi:hypothetical protein